MEARAGWDFHALIIISGYFIVSLFFRIYQQQLSGIVHYHLISLYMTSWNTDKKTKPKIKHCQLRSQDQILLKKIHTLNIPIRFYAFLI